MIQDEYARELITGALGSLRFAGIEPSDLLTADGDHLADELCRLLRSRYQITVEPAEVLATVADLL